MDNFLPFNITIYEAITLLLTLTLFTVLLFANCRRRHTLVHHVKSNKLDTDNSKATTPISVIVLADTQNGQDLMKTIPLHFSQEHPDFEVIVVNTDPTGKVHDILTILSTEYPQLRSTFIPDTVCNVSVRKLAIMLGIKAAKKGAVIVTEANCYPQSNQWLSAMTRHFDEGKDIVIGYCNIDNSIDNDFGRRYRNYDQTIEAAQYLSAAIHKHTFRADGRNIAYRTQLFFDNKGFSKTFNLKYGDDDIFITEIATKDNIAVEISPESILEQKDPDYSRYYSFNRSHRVFTLQQTRSSVLVMGSIQSVVLYAFIALCIGIVCWSTSVYLRSGDFIRPSILSGTAAVLYLTECFFNINAFRRYAGILKASKLFFTVPLFRLIRPIINKTYSVKANRADNYTWE